MLKLGKFFELEFFFFKWLKISPEIDWYHYLGCSCGTYVHSPASNNVKLKFPIRAKCVPLPVLNSWQWLILAKIKGRPRM